jgi:AcrR family transcriptional regulator
MAFKQPTSKRIPPRRRSQRARPAAADRRAQILREAMACFASRGFRGTTTRELAARVGITEAALYRYFPSKDALYGAIIDGKMAAAPLADTFRAASRSGDDRAALAALARSVFERGQADPDFLRILTFTALEGHELAEPFFAARVRSLRELLAEYVARRVREGAFRRVDPQLAARAFLGMVFDHLTARVVFGQEELQAEPIETVVDTFVSIFLGGVRAEEGAAAPRGSAGGGGDGRA